MHQSWGHFQIYLKGTLLAQVIIGRSSTWESSDHQIPQISQLNSRIRPCFYKKDSKGPFSICLHQKENNLFLASNTCSGSRVLDNFNFLTTGSQGRIFFLKQHAEMRSKLFALEFSGIKHTKKLSKEVCAERTQRARYERFLEVNGPFSEGTEAEVLCMLPQHSAPACTGEHVFAAGSKAGEPWQ